MGLCFGKNSTLTSQNLRTPTPELSNASSDDLQKTSDFESFLNIPVESGSDEINLSPTEDGYPQPVPVSKKIIENVMNTAQKIKWFENCGPYTGSDDASNDGNKILNQADLDRHARETPRSKLESYQHLISYFEQPFGGNSRRDEKMVRCFLVWLSNQEIEKFQSENGTKDTSLGYLSLLGQKRSTYSSFFTLLCRNAGIECAQIYGACKAGDYQPGSRKEQKDYWNAVFVNDKWQIIHPYWVCRSVFGKKPGGWIKLESSGKTVGKRQTESAGVLKNAFQEYYIMPDPEQFIYCCHPDEYQWQLLPNPITRERFFEQAYLLPPFWALGMKLLSENLCSLKSHGSNITISFEAPKKTANELNMDYDFFFKEENNRQQLNNKMLQQDKLPRLVTKIRNGSNWKFIIQFPVEGTYKIIIYASPNEQPLLRLCEFELKCTKRTQDCQLTPFNPLLLGFGPGPAAENAGLLIPSHRNGLVTAEKGRLTTMSFLLDSDISKTLTVKTSLYDSDSNDQSELVKSNIDKLARELRISISLIKDGEFGLQILTGKYTVIEDESENMKVACNYFLTTTCKFVKEKTNKRLARQNLLMATESGGIEVIEKSIQKCLKEKILESDLDIENAQRKLDILRFRKDVKDAQDRKNFDVTARTIENLKNSPYERIFRETIRQLTNFATELRSLKGFTQDLPSIKNAMNELARIHVVNGLELITNTFLALQILFGVEHTCIGEIEIKIPPTEPNYPDPIPKLDKKVKTADKIKWFEDWDTKTGSDDACNDDDSQINQSELDSHAKKAPNSLYKSYNQLISYLEQPAKGHPRRDEIMVQSILVWLSNQVVENFTAEEGRQDTPFGFLSLLGQKRSTYSTFFTVLCRNANIVCAQIHGVCKAGDYQPGDRNELYTFWNAVYVNETWQIIKPFWVCRSVFGKRSGGWIKLEASGKTIGQRETESAGVVRNAFQEYYIMPDPEQFIYRCHHDDKKWQLLPNPITRDTFFEQAYLLPPFWALGMRLLSQNSCSLTANGGTITISFEAAQNIANELNMDYEFLLKEEKNQGQSENEMLQPQKIPRLVTKIRNASKWDFIIQFPIEGKYKIIIYGSPNQQPLLRLCEFELVCKKRTHACQLTPFDPGLPGVWFGSLIRTCRFTFTISSKWTCDCRKGQTNKN